MYKKVWATIEKKGMTKKVKFALALTDFLKIFGINLKKKVFKDVLEAFGGEIRYAIAGGAAVDPDVLKGLKRFGMITIQGYGLTESAPIAALNQEHNNRDAAIGLPLPEVQLEIVNPDKDGIGEIRIKGPNVMMGYYEDPELTSTVLKDGWFYSGDIGYEDKDGFFYITGRKKNVIITKNGKNVFPEEVEAYLNKSPYILESMVVEKETKDEEDVKLFGIIVPNYEEIKKFLNKEELDKEEVHKLIAEEVRKTNRQMPIYKAVKEFEIRETELVKTTTKKIKRSANI
jgi:long-chain acyl-CoA synthetase